MMPGDDVLTKPVARRIEVFTGAGRRRRWSGEDKARIVAESYAGSVGDVADRYGLSKTQVFTWRREARTKFSAPVEPAFVPVVVESAPIPTTTASNEAAGRRRRSGNGEIELEIGGGVVRIMRGADIEAVAAIIRALRA
jgi:transposase